jgi:aromatic-L-amino-acid/L-tryptophan decarboxylase
MSMPSSAGFDRPTSRSAPLEMTEEEFRSLGHDLVDRIASFLGSLRGRAVTPAEPADKVRLALGAARTLPEQSAEAGALLKNTADLLFEHSLFNGHPGFYGYITSSAAPIGMLAELLAAAVNANVGAWKLSPMATEIEAQTIRWLAQFIGYPVDCGGLLLSGGNMANLTCFLAARVAKAGWDVRKQGVASGPRMLAYASAETHTWLQKAADLAGLGTDAIRWIGVDKQQRIDLAALEIQYKRDFEEGHQPFLVVGTAGTVSTGAVDPLPNLAAFCQERKLWFHVDGAYGAFAAGIKEAPAHLMGLTAADSVAVDPHKWLYAPLEAGCALVRDPAALRNAFSYHPPYYSFDVEATNYYDLGPQNSRGFRALKIWLALQQAGAAAYREMIGEDVALARHLYELAAEHPELEAFSHNLSITTLRFVPLELRASVGSEQTEAYLNRLNQLLLTYVENSGEAFCSNALIEGKTALRFCIVNFRTSTGDIEAVPPLVARLGRQALVELNGQ